VYTSAASARPWHLCFRQGEGWRLVPAHSLPQQAEAGAPTAGLPGRELSGEDGKAVADARYRVVHELMQTEQSYVCAMRLVERTLHGPAKEGEILPEMQLAKIFSCVSDLLRLSEQVLAQLQRRLSSWSSETCVGDLFVRLCTEGVDIA
jgi:hypothetical protein